MRHDLDLSTDRPTFVSHLECSATGATYPPGEVYGLSEAGAPLLVRYHLAEVSRTLAPEALDARPPDLWRYRELLPVRHTENIVSLGEAMTPLVELPRIGGRLGAAEVLIKDEGRLPTGSFKARGLAMAVSMAKELGLERLAMPTNGNAGAALAAYGSRAGMETFVFCPEDTPEVNVREIALKGTHVFRGNGLIDDGGRIVAEGVTTMGWFDVSTLKEPYRIEGKKTMGYELAEQLGWELPDVIFYPTGGGTGLIGMWKAFAELGAMGWIGDHRPRMVAVQASGCAPIVRAWREGSDHAERWEGAHTIASGIRVPAAIGDVLILRAVRESGGFAIDVPDDAIAAGQAELAGTEGLLTSPEGAATFAAYLAALDRGLVSTDDRVVLFNCGNGLKYPMPAAEARIDKDQPVDWSSLGRS